MTNTPTLPASKEAEAVDSDGTLLQVATEDARALLMTVKASGANPTAQHALEDMCERLLDTLATKDTALAEMRVELERLRHTTQSRYELLRECQTELRTLQDNPEGGLVEAIARALGPSLLDEGVKRG